VRTHRFSRGIQAGGSLHRRRLRGSATAWLTSPAAAAPLLRRSARKNVLVLWAAEPRSYAGDTDWPYRQENNFYYLTGIFQPGCIFVLVPGGATIHEILFVPPSNPAQERWTGPGTPEYEIQAQFEFTFLRRNAHWGYPCIVASGLNATTLHYETNRDTMKAGDLLLMDDAAEFDGYSVDVTRTIPVSGKYSKEQAEIYRLVWEGQRAGIEAALPGKTNADITAAADKVMAEGLVKLGLMTDVNSKQQ
jgi:Xaa-Pro aminopeptidase